MTEPVPGPECATFVTVPEIDPLFATAEDGIINNETPNASTAKNQLRGNEHRTRERADM
jgi:hypothetical protein